jgi:serine/threonine protein kinase
MENTIIDGRYALLAAIGSGGEARVYQATDTLEGKDVAVRLALRHDTQMSAEPPASFHENWVRLLATGTDPQYGPYQVFELLQGQTLGQFIKVRTLTPDEWMAFVQQSLNAVGALHAAGWVHGDINADNLFAQSTGWKLLELPFLRFTPPKGRSPIFGSIHTLSPEQIDGAKASERSDLYSLGCLYYYAASGIYPHPGANSQDVAIHCLRFAPEPLGEKAPTLPPAWSNWVMNFLTRKPEERVATVAAAYQLLGVA